MDCARKWQGAREGEGQLLDRQGYFTFEVLMTFLDRKEVKPALTNTGIFIFGKK